MMWYILKEMIQSDKNSMSADVRIPSDSPWFDGHFPGEPILPGVAQIGMVFDTIRKARTQKLKISSVRRVRFKRIIRPDDELKIVIAPLKQEADVYSFRILNENEAVCSGVMTVENQNELRANIPEKQEKN